MAIYCGTVLPWYYHVMTSVILWYGVTVIISSYYSGVPLIISWYNCNRGLNGGFTMVKAW